MIQTLPVKKQATTLDTQVLLRFANLVYEQFGLVFPESQLSILDKGIRHAYAASTCATMLEYLELLKDKDGAADRERLGNALTVSESYFFRDRLQFDALYTQVLPQIIERRKMLRTIRIWSAGCGSGEEPYSVAMLLGELLPPDEEWTIQILATDINTRALDMARKGIYRDWSFREQRSCQLRKRYFEEVREGYQVKPELRERVSFAYLNLAGSDYPAFENNTRLVDLILCRNVILNFSEAEARQVMERMYGALGPGGWMAVGHSEYTPNTFERFLAVPINQAIFYRRASDVPTVPRSAAGQAGRSEPTITAKRPGASRPLTPGDLIQQTRELDPLQIAQDLYSFGHPQKALDLLLGMALSHSGPVSGNQAMLSGLLGQACASLNDWVEAERWLIAAINGDRQNPEPYYTLGLVFQHQQHTGKAIEVMKRVVQLNPQHILGYYCLASLYQSLSQPHPALEALENCWGLLNELPAEELLPGQDGVTAGTLREVCGLIRRQLENRLRASQPPNR